MSYAIVYVPHGQLSYSLPGLIRNLARSELWTGGRAAVDDIVKFLYTEEMQLWVIYNPETHEQYGYVITELKQYPKKKMLVVQYTAGDYGMLDGAADLVFGTLEHFAKAEKCDGVESFGRLGWKPTSKKYGYRVQAIVYEKLFT
jgi:hypothetical protein